VVVLGTAEASANYSGADLRLRKGDDPIDTDQRQVYVNVKVKTALHFFGRHRTLWERACPAKAIIQAMTVTLLTLRGTSPLPQGTMYSR